MKKILFVDYIWQPGHVNFNQIHIDALKRSGADIKLVLYESMKKQLPYDDSSYSWVIPDFFQMRKGHPFLNRLGFLLVLLMIRLKIKLNNYDGVYVSSFDELTLGLCPLGKRMLLVAHDNAKGFAYTLKRFFLKRLSKHARFIVFNKSMLMAFIDNDIKNVNVISHGCMRDMGTTNIETGIDFGKYSMVVLQASPKMDNSFLEKVINNQSFRTFIANKNILLLLRNCDIDEGSDNIISINRYLSRAEYLTMMDKSDVILLAYPESFKYQVSGVSFECIAKNKNLVIFDNPYLHYCRDFYNYDPIFSDVQGFILLLQDLMDKEKNMRCSVAVAQMQPDYNPILKML